MKFIKTPYAIIYFCFLILTSCKSTKLNCEYVKDGTFHVYLANGQHFLVIRKDTIQSEINLTTGDTSYWRVKWLSNCDYTTHYVSGGHMESKEMEEFFKKSVAQLNVQKVTSQYYVFTGVVKTPKGDRTYTDTAWLKEK